MDGERRAGGRGGGGGVGVSLSLYIKGSNGGSALSKKWISSCSDTLVSFPYTIVLVLVAVADGPWVDFLHTYIPT